MGLMMLWYKEIWLVKMNGLCL